MKYQTIAGLLTLTLLYGCSSSDKVVPDVPPSQLYSESQESLQSGNWQTAIKKLEALDSRYPFGAYSKQVQLNLIYAYYKSDDYAMALATSQRFVRLNPTHPQIDWVLYMRGLIYMAQDRNFVQEFVGMDRSDRDPEPAKSAFADFKKLLKRYPNSLYAKDAKKRMESLKHRIADYDLATADFYLRRKAYIAAINRAQEIQKTYPDTQAARKSIPIELKAYQALGLKKPIERTKKLMDLNPVK